MLPPPCISSRPPRRKAFTLVELLVAMTVLVLIIGMIAQMTGGMASIIGRGQAHIDTDEQARALLDRMSLDFGAMVKRADVDYYLKGRPGIIDSNYLQQKGNDQIAFYSEVPGYYRSTNNGTLPSTVSLIAYRVNSDTMRLERLSKGLSWTGNADAASDTLNFLPVPLASPLPSPLPVPMPANPPEPVWKQAASANQPDPDGDYEELAPQVFRFEYYYVLKGQAVTVDQTGQVVTGVKSTLSVSPWYAKDPVYHTSVNGMQDVAGIGVLIAVIDPKSRTLVTKDQLTTLAGNMEDMPDDLANPGDIETKWAAAVITAGTNNTIPKQAAAAIRIYTRCFYLNKVSP